MLNFNIELFYIHLFLTISLLLIVTEKYFIIKLFKKTKTVESIINDDVQEAIGYVRLLLVLFVLIVSCFFVFYSNRIYNLFMLYSFYDMFINIIVLDLYFASLSQYCTLFIIEKFVSNCTAAFVVF